MSTYILMLDLTLAIVQSLLIIVAKCGVVSHVVEGHGEPIQYT